MAANLLLYCEGQFFAVVLSVHFRLSHAVVAEHIFFVFVVVLAANGVEVVVLPVPFRGLCLIDFIVGLHLQVVLLQVLIRHHVVIPVRRQRQELFLFLNLQ